MYTVGFDQIKKEDIEIAGGKGANLGELTQHHIAVPQGFVVTTKGYEYYLAENHLEDRIYNLLAQAQDENQLKKACEKIRSSIQQANIPEDMLDEIKLSYLKMGDKVRVAIRSSATAEDLADASFAGQQETYLNVQGVEEVIQRVKDCFASCFGDRAVAYRKENEVSQETVKAAVVVQEMIEAETAGVMFTANVLNGNRLETVINASYGLGEAVVSGMVTPDQYILNVEGKEISSYIGSKKIQIIYDVHETKECPVRPELRDKRALGEEMVRKLYDEGKNIEKLYGRPMDIEWVSRGEKVYILQARPITTLNEVSQEMKFPEKLNKKEKAMLAFQLEHCPYAYYPLDFEIGMIQGAVKEQLFSSFGLVMPSTYKMNEEGVVTLGRSKMGINGAIIHLPKVFMEMRDRKKNLTVGKKEFTECKKALQSIEDIDLERVNEKQCAKLLEELKAIQKRIAWLRFRYFIFPAVIYGKGFNRYLKKVGNVTEYDLLGELNYKTWVVNKELAQLVKELKENKVFYEQMDIGYELINERFPRESQLIQTFLNRHGYRSEFNCYPFSASSWNEEPERLLNLLKQMMAMPSQKSQKKRHYSELMAQLKQTAGKKAAQLEEQIEYYRVCHVYREDSQYLWETCFALMRKVLKRLIKIWQINEESELWFLTYEELLEACQHGFTQQEKKQIQRRKQSRRKAEGYWRQLSKLIVEESKDSQILQGVSGSSGTMSGRACLVRSREEFSKLKKGDILICPFTEPEWTPLFALASAVVSDTGGSLSHAAIVAREYGIPAVLGTGKGTQIIKDGEKITVDGDNGRVVLQSGTAN